MYHQGSMKYFPRMDLLRYKILLQVYNTKSILEQFKYPKPAVPTLFPCGIPNSDFAQHDYCQVTFHTKLLEVVYQPHCFLILLSSLISRELQVSVKMVFTTLPATLIRSTMTSSGRISVVPLYSSRLVTLSYLVLVGDKKKEVSQ